MTEGYIIPPSIIQEEPIDIGEYTCLDESAPFFATGKHNHDAERAALLKGTSYLTYGINFIQSSPKIPYDYTEGIYFHATDNVDSIYEYFSSGRSVGRFNPENIKSGMKKYIWNFLKQDRQDKQTRLKEIEDVLSQGRNDQNNYSCISPRGYDLGKPISEQSANVQEQIIPYDIIQIFEIYDVDPLFVNSGEPEGELICRYHIVVAKDLEDTFLLTPITLSEKDENKPFFAVGSFILKED